MNDSEFIELYTKITECAEAQARSVYMVMSESLRTKRTGAVESTAGDGRTSQPATAPPENQKMP